MNDFQKNAQTQHLSTTSKGARALPGPCTLGGLKVEPSCEHRGTSRNITEAKAKAPVVSDMALCKGPLISEDSSTLAM